MGGQAASLTGIRAIVSIGGLLTPALAATAQSSSFTFASYQSYATGTESTGIDIGDLNGDGFPDVAISNRATNNVSVLLNAGDGSFLAQSTIAVGIEPRYVVAADFDGDCDLDLVTVDRGSDQVTVLLNDGAATFTLGQIHPLFQPTWLITCDFDGDGDEDILVTHWDPAAALPGSSPGLVTMLVNDGSASFTLATPWSIGIQPRGGDVADVDGDGRLDLIVNNLESDDLTILLMDPGATLRESRTVAVGDGPRYVVARNLDGDNDVDLGVIHKHENSLWILRNNGAASFTTDLADRYATQGNPHSVTAADLDGDDVPEIIVSHMAALAIDVYGNDGSGMFGVSSIFSPSGVPHAATVDLTGDGDLDLLTSNFNGTLRVHRNLTPQIGPSPCPGDTNGDGQIGIVDFLEVLADWGRCCPAASEGCPADAVLSGDVGISDFLWILANWGSCP